MDLNLLTYVNMNQNSVKKYFNLLRNIKSDFLILENSFGQN